MSTPKAHAPRKRFGQNFLVAPGIADHIVAAINPRPGDRLVEIGPGKAALTAPLLARAGHLDALEIDRDLVSALRARFPAERLTIHQGDALQFDFASLGDELRIVGNLPYNISTPLLFHLAQYADRVRDMHFMLQLEVVERMVATPGNSEYGRLSVMLQYRYVMEQLFVVPPEAFVPAPRVHSALVRMLPRPAADLAARDDALLGRVVQEAFGQRRKMLRNTLRALIGADRLEQLGIAPTLRAEDLAPEDFVRLANSIAGAPGAPGAPAGR